MGHFLGEWKVFLSRPLSLEQLGFPPRPMLGLARTAPKQSNSGTKPHRSITVSTFRSAVWHPFWGWCMELLTW